LEADTDADGLGKALEMLKSISTGCGDQSKARGPVSLVELYIFARP